MREFVDLSLSEQLKITEITVDRWRSLFGLTDAAAECLRTCHEEIGAQIDSIVAEFHEWQVAQPEIALVIGDKDTLEQLARASTTYIQELFEGYYDLLYVNKRLRVGRVHHRIGVTPTLFLASISKLQDILRPRVVSILAGRDEQDRTQEVLLALGKILLFDSQIIFEAYFIGLSQQIENSCHELVDQAEKLKEKVAEKTEWLTHLSMHDPLTGMLNRRAFLDGLRRDIAMAERSGQPVSLVFVDVNRFKALNDTEGHAAGDKMLRIVARSMSRAARDTDTVCRYGGDEFCAILPRSGAEDSRKYCQRMIDLFDRENTGDITFSIGIAQTGPDTFIDKDDLVCRADKAMYQAKRDGAGRRGHQVACYSGGDEPESNVTRIA